MFAKMAIDEGRHQRQACAARLLTMHRRRSRRQWIFLLYHPASRRLGRVSAGSRRGGGGAPGTWSRNGGPRDLARPSTDDVPHGHAARLPDVREG